MTRKLGIIAGGKELPLEVITHCRQVGRPYFVLAIEGQTDPITVQNSDHQWIRIGAIGQAVKAFKKNNVLDVVMVGSINRPAWSEIVPDLKGAIWLARLAKNAFGDDSTLRIIINEIEKEGFHVIGAQDLIGNKLFASKGVIGNINPDEQGFKDIRHGIKVATLLGTADIGQSVIVQDGIVLGVEAVEGTSGLITRCQQLHRPGLGGVLVKIAKPIQDRRVDLPTIGEQTIELAYKAGLRGIAVQAGSVQIMQQQKVIDLANQYGLFIYGISDDQSNEN